MNFADCTWLVAHMICTRNAVHIWFCTTNVTQLTYESVRNRLDLLHKWNCTCDSLHTWTCTLDTTHCTHASAEQTRRSAQIRICTISTTHCTYEVAHWIGPIVERERKFRVCDESGVQIAKKKKFMCANCKFMCAMGPIQAPECFLSLLVKTRMNLHARLIAHMKLRRWQNGSYGSYGDRTHWNTWICTPDSSHTWNCAVDTAHCTYENVTHCTHEFAQ